MNNDRKMSFLDHITDLSESLVRLDERIGFKRLFSYLLIILLIIGLFNFKTIVKETIELYNEVSDQIHDEKMIKRDEILADLNDILKEYRALTGADRVLYFEYHNSKENLAGIPFKYIDLVMQDRAYWATGIPIDMYRDINIGAITSLYEDLKTSIVIFCVSNCDPTRGPGWRQMTIDEFHDSYSGAYDIFQSDGQRQQVYVSIPGPKQPIGLMIFEWLDEDKEIDRGRVIEVTAAFVPRITGLMSVTTK
jgi:hypothetical protein